MGKRGERVVITGLGCVSPLALDVPKTWQAVMEGRSGIGPITCFDASAFRSRIAGELKGFDAEALLPPKEVRKMDPFSHYAVVAADEAMRDSGLEIDEELAPQVGVSVGIGIGGMSTISRYEKVLTERGPQRITPFLIPMVIANMAAGQISLRHNCRNYSACTISACSSSNHAIGDAARMIERGDAQAMIVGGAEAAITPLTIGGFSAMRALSMRNDDPERASRPYDKDRDGFVMSEGAGILILESLEHAARRGARIYCELAGYGYSSDAYHITSPNVDGPSRAMAMTLRDGACRAEDVDYINAHGTSTPVGDENELQAIKEVFGAHAQRVSISSTKSMTGHLLGAAGALEAVISVKALEEGVIPPTINVEVQDPACDLDVTPNTARERKLSVILSNSFGFGGTNASLLFTRM